MVISYVTAVNMRRDLVFVKPHLIACHDHAAMCWDHINCNNSLQCIRSEYWLCLWYPWWDQKGFSLKRNHSFMYETTTIILQCVDGVARRLGHWFLAGQRLIYGWHVTTLWVKCPL